MIRSWARETRIPRQVLPEHARAGTEGDLARATAQPGITIAAHSWSHPNLARLEKSDLDDELCRPIDWVHERFPNAVSWLAYPYGLTSHAVERAVVAAGYDGAVLLGWQWRPRWQHPLRPHAVPRINIPAGISIHGFALRTAGVVAR